MFFLASKNSRWLTKFRSAHPYVCASSPNRKALRLILGVGRSGTSWVSQVFSKTQTPCRFYSEPLFHLAPRLPFHKEGDHTAIGYEQVTEDHPLVNAYELLVHPQFDTSVLKTPARDDPSWNLCLVKEVHALLGTEGLLRTWATPAVFILRDGVYIADSLFAAQSLQTIYLDHEVEAVQKKAFLDRFLPGRQAVVERLFAEAERRQDRVRVIVRKLICIQLLQEMFCVLAKEFPCATAINYEEFCDRPAETFARAAAALGFSWDAAMQDYLAKTMQADGTSADPYSVMRNTNEQKSRPLKFLTDEERMLARSVLEALAA
jgi:hypothetical protein